MIRLTPRTLGLGAALTTAYVLAASLGFQVAFVADQVTTVWAPTGLAQAALVLWGRGLWPAVWFGAFFVNAATDAPLWTAAVIASGNTLEAVTAAWLLGRRGFDPALRRARDSLLFIVAGAGVATVVSATIGVTALSAAGVESWSRFGSLWFAWWLGDGIGALVVGPLVMTIARPQTRATARGWIETALLVAATVVVTHAVFGQWVGRGVGHHPLEYVIFPFLITAAVRQRQPATSFVVLAAAIVAIWNTVRGLGPFAGPELHESLVLLQLFMGIVAGTGLLLAAAIAERETSERRRAAAHAVSEILASARSLPEAADHIVRGVCEELHWTIGALWLVDRDAQQLRCLTTWPPPGIGGEFAADTLRRTFPYGTGLPGRVWESGRSTWIENVLEDPNFPRAPLAQREGLCSAFAFAIKVNQEVHGVLEFFSRSVVPPDQDLLDTMSTVGNQLGQFVVRTQVEAAVVAARRDAEDANRAKDEFLATLSHELRTPLNAIVGWTRMLLERTLDEQNRQRALEVIDRNAQLQAKLVDDILDVSGIISGGLKLHLVPVELGSVIGAALESLGPAAAAKRIDLQYTSGTGRSFVNGDASRLQQIVWNLVANAIKFTPAGGRVDVTLAEGPGPTLRVVVRDDGDGIDPGFLPHVFDRFRQADTSARRLHGGLGLGLAIVRYLVQLHGGSVHAASEGHGKGSTFVVELPAVTTNPDEAPAA